MSLTYLQILNLNIFIYYALLKFLPFFLILFFYIFHTRCSVSKNINSTLNSVYVVLIYLLILLVLFIISYLMSSELALISNIKDIILIKNNVISFRTTLFSFTHNFSLIFKLYGVCLILILVLKLNLFKELKLNILFYQIIFFLLFLDLIYFKSLDLNLKLYILIYGPLLIYYLYKVFILIKNIIKK